MIKTVEVGDLIELHSIGHYSCKKMGIENGSCYEVVEMTVWGSPLILRPNGVKLEIPVGLFTIVEGFDGDEEG